MLVITSNKYSKESKFLPKHILKILKVIFKVYLNFKNNYKMRFISYILLSNEFSYLIFQE